MNKKNLPNKLLFERQYTFYGYGYTLFPPPLNIEITQIITAITTTTAIIPTAAPALKIPPTTEQLLNTISVTTSIERFNFFIYFYFNYEANRAGYLLFLTTF